jgi:hypothetical protein
MNLLFQGLGGAPSYAKTPWFRGLSAFPTGSMELISDFNINEINRLCFVSRGRRKLAWRLLIKRGSADKGWVLWNASWYSID